jgi:hypothetical protein
MKDWYDSFIKALYKKYPKRSQLTEALMDLLSIEKESAYRRLRKEIVFPVHELVKIASAWNISLDEIVGISSKQVTFKVQIWDYLNPSNEELKDMQLLVDNHDQVKDFPDMEYMEVSNRLSRILTSGFPYLNKLHLLKWMYQYVNEEVLEFSKIDFPKRVSALSLEYYKTSKNIANVSFIWDQMLFNYLIHDINYFHSIYLISDREKELLKKDLHDLLDYMEEVAAKGCWPETGNKVSLYISQINIDTNYSYYYSDFVKLCRVHAFAKNEIFTYDQKMVENFKNWMQSKKKSSVQISEADEKSRITFFMEQRKLVDTLICDK